MQGEATAENSDGNATAGAPGKIRDADARGDLLFSAWIGLIALLPRLYVALAWAREPVWDGHYYDFGARRIAAGLGYSDGTTVWHPWCHWPVGYSGFLAGLYQVFGAGPQVATVAGAVIGALVVVFVHRLARLWLSPLRARVAALLCALHPGLIVFAALIMSEPLAALVFVVAAWLVIRDKDRAPWRGALAAGFVLGLGTLVRPTFVAVVPGIAWLLWRSRAERNEARRWAVLDLRALAMAGAATAIAVATVLPWTMRNCRVMDRCAFVSTNGGWNLAIGAFSRATGRFETLRSSDGCAVVTGQVQQDSCWRDLALDEILARPGRWIGLIPKKLGFTFDHESFPIEYLHEADPDRWPELSRQRGRGLLTVMHRLLLTFAAFSVIATQASSVRGRIVQAALGVGLAISSAWLWVTDEPAPFYLLPLATLFIGLAPLPGRPPGGAVMRWILLALGSTIATHAVLFGEDRYHVVIAPLLCILAAGALRLSGETAREGLGTATPSGPMPVPGGEERPNRA